MSSNLTASAVSIVIRGVVMKGEGRGRALGYPTANIPLHDASLNGVYAASVLIHDTEYRAAVFIDQTRHILEAHVLDWSHDLYGQTIDVTLLQKIRDAKHFNDEAALKAAIAEDIRIVRST